MINLYDNENEIMPAETRKDNDSVNNVVIAKKSKKCKDKNPAGLEVGKPKRVRKNREQNFVPEKLDGIHAVELASQSNHAETTASAFSINKIPAPKSDLDPGSQEVAMIIEPSAIDHEQASKFFNLFYLKQSCDPSFLRPVLKARAGHAKAISDFEDMLLKNKVEYVKNKSLFTVFVQRLGITGLCLWTHRPMNSDSGLSGACNLGDPGSTLFPFAAVVFSPEKFLELVFTYPALQAASISSSAKAHTAVDEFKLLSDEVTSLRMCLTQLLGADVAASMRLTFVLGEDTKISTFLMKYVGAHNVRGTGSVNDRYNDALLYLSLELGVAVSQGDRVEYLHQASRSLAQSVRRKETTVLSCVQKLKNTKKISTLLQCADGEDSNLGTNTFSADLNQAWTNMLTMVPQVSAARATNFTRRYTCPLAAMRAVKRAIDDEKENAHANAGQHNNYATANTLQQRHLATSGLSLYQQVLTAPTTMPPLLPAVQRKDNFVKRDDVKYVFKRDFGPVGGNCLGAMSSNTGPGGVEEVSNLSWDDESLASESSRILAGTGAPNSAHTHLKKVSAAVYSMLTSTDPNQTLE